MSAAAARSFARSRDPTDREKHRRWILPRHHGDVCVTAVTMQVCAYVEDSRVRHPAQGDVSCGVGDSLNSRPDDQDVRPTDRCAAFVHDGDRDRRLVRATACRESQRKRPQQGGHKGPTPGSPSSHHQFAYRAVPGFPVALRRPRDGGRLVDRTFSSALDEMDTERHRARPVFHR